MFVPALYVANIRLHQNLSSSPALCSVHDWIHKRREEVGLEEIHPLHLLKKQAHGDAATLRKKLLLLHKFQKTLETLPIDSDHPHPRQRQPCKVYLRWGLSVHLLQVPTTLHQLPPIRHFSESETLDHVQNPFPQ